MAPASLQKFPPEILLQIADRLETMRDLASLVGTCRHLNGTLTPKLYYYGFRFDPFDLLATVCFYGTPNAVKHVLTLGADPTYQDVSWTCVSDDLKDGFEEDKIAYTMGGNEKGSFRHWGSPSLPWFDDHDDDWLDDEVEKDYVPEIDLPFVPELRMRPAAVESNWLRHGGKEWYEAIEDNPGTTALGRSPVHLAAVLGHIEILRLLLDHKEGGAKVVNSLCPGFCRPYRIKPEGIGRIDTRYKITDDMDTIPPTFFWTLHTPLRSALCAGQGRSAQLLIDHGADLAFDSGFNGEHDHALHMAARFGHVDVINNILARPGINMDVNVKDYDGWTPLCHAIASTTIGNDAVAMLLSCGADPNCSLAQPDGKDDGLTHLHFACWDREWKKAAQLLASGPSQNVNAVFKPSISARSTYRNARPYRAIDLVCTELNNSITGDKPKSHNTDQDRADLLRALIKDHRANTDICPSTTGRNTTTIISPILLAASNPKCSIKLLSVFQSSGLLPPKTASTLMLDLFRTPSFHGQITHSTQNIESPSSKLMETFQYLVSKDGTLHDFPHETQLSAILSFFSRMRGENNLAVAIDVLMYLIQESRLNPNLEATLSKDSGQIQFRGIIMFHGEKHNLFRALLCIRNLLDEPHCRIFRGLVDIVLETTNDFPSNVDILRDFFLRLSKECAWEEWEIEMDTWWDEGAAQPRGDGDAGVTKRLTVNPYHLDPGFLDKGHAHAHVIESLDYWVDEFHRICDFMQEYIGEAAKMKTFKTFCQGGRKYKDRNEDERELVDLIGKIFDIAGRNVNKLDIARFIYLVRREEARNTKS